jgi:CubicO group peptidase (beta-lactamase class C family)
MRDNPIGDLRPLIEEAMEEWHVPGLAIAVVQEDEPLLLAAYGRRDVEADMPVTTDTQFALCSITKSFTAAGLGILVDERRLDWTKPVRDYIPEFRLHDPVATDRVTVRDLLCHHSGLPRHDWIWMPGDLSRAEMLAAMRHLEPTRDIRARFQYQNLGYLVAGMVAERITGQSWEDFTRDRLLNPLEMTRVGFAPEDLQKSGDGAWPYVVVEEERRRARLWPITDTPAGGLNASISGMVNYLRFYHGDGRFKEKQLLSPEIIRLMQTPLVYVDPPQFEEFGDHHYGLGLATYYYRGERVVTHGGGWIGWGTQMSMLPVRRLGVVVLTNRSPSPVTDLLVVTVFDRICGKEPIPWIERFQARKRRFLEHRQADRTAHEAAGRRGAAPPRPLDEYAGAYEHPGYGRITIEAGAEGLGWVYRGLAGGLAHRHYDVFEVPEDPMSLSPDLLPVTFLYDRNGHIDRLSAPFEPLAPEILFTRLPEGDATDPAFRAACAGIYLEGVTRHVVALDGDGQITLSSTGQPTCDLVPYRDRIFRIRDLDGYRVEFRRNDRGVVDAIVFHQPDGTFMAERIEEKAAGG